MGLSFLVPAFLAGLAAIAIPIWVHLRNRTKTDTIEFPSLMFLERVPYRSVQRQQLRHRLLFAARCAAFLLLALAFSRPFLGGVDLAGAASRGDREIVILLDRSWSMGYEDRWERALDAAAAEVSGLVAGDRASLVFFDQTAEVAVESTADRADLTAALLGAEPGVSTTRIVAGLRAASQLLAASSLPSREVVLISDFQRIGWSEDDDIDLPQGTLMRPINLSVTPASNIGVAGVGLERQQLSVGLGAGSDSDAGDTGVVVTARITRQGGDEAGETTVRLLVEGIVVQEQAVSLPPNGAARVTFEAVGGGAGALRGTVSVEPDGLPEDDEFHFVSSSTQALSVLLVQSVSASESDALYVERALRIGSRPPFRVERVTLGDVQSASLASHDLIIVNDVGAIGSDTAGALREYVSAGGGVLVGLAELSGVTSSGWLPFAAGEEADRSRDLGATLAYVDTDHPMFEVFRSADSADLAAARFYRYRLLDPVPQEGVLARYDDGSPALVEVRMAEGRVLVWTSSLDTFWTDLPLQPVFLPLLHEMSKHAAGYRETEAWLAAGRGLGQAELAMAARGGRALESLDDLQVAPETGAQIERLAGDRVRLWPGFHRVSWSGGTGSVAANLERSEADLGSLDAEELAAAVVWDTGGEVDSNVPRQATGAEIERRQSLWWYLLVAAAILLVAETVLSNRLSPRLGAKVSIADNSPAS